MSIRNTALAAVLASAFSLPAMAGPIITVDGITFTTGAIFETIDLFEAEAFGDGFGNDNGIIDQQGERLVGVGIVNRIRANDPDAGNPVLWESGDNDKILTLYFYDYVAENLSIDGNTLHIGFTGGRVDLYSQDDPLDPNYIPQATQAAGIANATQGNLWLSLAGSPIGIEALESGAEVGAVSGNPITLASSGPLAGVAGLLLASGALDVTGVGGLADGAANGFFNTQTFTCVDGGTGANVCPDNADKVFTSSGQVAAASVAGGWAFFGTGEVQNFAQQVPEPGTLALLGMGLAGLGFVARRRTKVELAA